MKQKKVFVIFVYYLFATCRSILLKFLLQYHGWMMHPNSLRTKIWYIGFKFLRLRNANLHDYQGQYKIYN